MSEALVAASNWSFLALGTTLKAGQSSIPIIDLFAGPGGLGEGFSAFSPPRGRPGFRIRLSIEKDPAAFETLRLRSFTGSLPLAISRKPTTSTFEEISTERSSSTCIPIRRARPIRKH